jgi:CRP-like cAMP-binding protein
MLNVLAKKFGGWVNLTEPELAAIARLPGRRLTLARGDDPFGQIECVDHALLMLEGWAADYKDRCNGKRVIVELMLPGDMTRLDTAEMNGGSIGTVMLSPGRVMLVPLASINEILKYEAVAIALRWAEFVRESIRREWIVNVGSRKVHARLAHLLCELSVRMNGVALCENGVCGMPLTQADLADALCVSDVHLNVAMQQLRKLGAVQVATKRLRILDWDRLAAIAEFDDEYLHRHPVKIRSVARRPALQNGDPGHDLGRRLAAAGGR